MAHIEVTEEELTAGAFPPICAKTGRPTTRLVETPLTIMPRWSRVLLVLGVAPWFAARPFIGHKVVAQLPLDEGLAKRATRSRSDLVAAMLGGIAATAVGSVIPHDGLQVGLVAVGFLIVAGSVVALVLGERDYGVDLRPTAWGTVMLRRIHPRLRDALVRGDALIDEPSIDDVIATGRGTLEAADPWA